MYSLHRNQPPLKATREVVPQCEEKCVDLLFQTEFREHLFLDQIRGCK